MLDICFDEPRKICPDCNRQIANEHDEAVHNTGECGCKESHTLCWRVWNADETGERCLAESVHFNLSTESPRPDNDESN